MRRPLARAAGRGATVCALALALAACAPLERSSRDDFVTPGVRADIHRSPNFNERRPNFVILHHTHTETTERALDTLTRRGSGVSSHYLIARDGRLMYLVDERRRAWHAGDSYWAGQRDMNSASIGIELDNNGREPFAEPMIQTLLALLADLKARYKLPATAFIGHADVAPGRKQDPSALFPWRRLAQAGFGLWCDPPYPSVPRGLDDALLLQTFGYSLEHFDAAVAAFKRRFSPDDPTPVMTEKDRSMLYCLVLRMQESAAQ